MMKVRTIFIGPLSVPSQVRQLKRHLDVLLACFHGQQM